jgi:hypothetical protein
MIRSENDRYRRTAEAPDLANGRPLTTIEQSSALMPSDGEVCPRPWKNTSEERGDALRFPVWQWDAGRLI